MPPGEPSQLTARRPGKLQSPRGWLRRVVIGVLVLLAVGATRYPWRSQYAFDFDPANYVLGVRDFDLTRHQPHPPGCPLFVMAGRGLNTFVHDANLSLEMIAWLASAIAVLAVAGATRRAGGNAWIAGLILLTQPIFWTAGEMAEPYTCSAMLFALMLLLVVRGPMGRHEPWRLAAMSLVVGLGAGLRPSVAVLLAPAWLWEVLRRRSWSDFGANATLVIAGIAAWFVPLLMDTGGLAAYRASHQPLEGLFSESSVIFGASLGSHARMAVRLTLWLIMLAAPAIVLFLAARARPKRYRASGPGLDPRRIAVILLLIAHPILFYGLIHFMKPYYALSIAGPLAFAAGLAAAYCRKPALRNGLATAIIAVQAGWFLGGYHVMGDRLFGRVTAGNIQAHDARTAANIALCRSVPDDMPFVFLEGDEPWPGSARILQCYLPEADFACLLGERSFLRGRQFFRDEPTVFEVDDQGLAVAAPAVFLVDENRHDVNLLARDDPASPSGPDMPIRFHVSQPEAHSETVMISPTPGPIRERPEPAATSAAKSKRATNG